MFLYTKTGSSLFFGEMIFLNKQYVMTNFTIILIMWYGFCRV